MPTSAVLSVSRAIDDALILAAASAADRPSRVDPNALTIAIALSGGRDSMVLLDALAAAAPEHAVSLLAIHVHHGLSPNAGRWVDFCVAECAQRAVPLTVHRVQVEKTALLGVEAAARAARYGVFAAVVADFVALAHHAGDQAETLLLQLLRGAGPHGLAAMPRIRPLPPRSSLLRPLIALPEAAIDAYANARGLAWIEDESNADLSLKRNFLRHEIAPRLAAAFPGYPETLARAAAHQAEAAQMLDALAALDAEGALDHDRPEGPTLDRAALSAWASRDPSRARNLLRWFVRQNRLPTPSAVRLAEMLDQLVHAAPDARVRLAHAGVEFGVHRGRVIVHAPPSMPYSVRWQGEAAVELPHGTLAFASRVGAGIAHATMAGTAVTIRPRAGGERLRLVRGGPSRSLKQLLHDAGMPPWQRDSLPLVFCGDVLAAVPGIGVDVAFQAAAGAPGNEVRWWPQSGQG